MQINEIRRPWQEERSYQGPKKRDPFYHTSTWRRIRNEFIRLNPYCKCGAKSVVADHKIRRKDGGSDDFSNLEALCYSCHQSKSAGESNRNRK